LTEQIGFNFYYFKVAFRLIDLEKEKTARKLSSVEVTAISHLYRGEMARANVWRSRLDVTTNWAIVTTAAFLSVAFGNEEMPHFIIILATIFVLFFLIIESRRYRFFDLWRWRVALLNENFFAAVIDPHSESLHIKWQKLLSDDLKFTRFKISFLEAFGRRLRRNYGWIFIVLATCWLAKVSIHPTPAMHFSEVVQRAELYHLLPGWVMLGVGAIFNLGLIAIAIVTFKSRQRVVKMYKTKKDTYRGQEME